MVLALCLLTACGGKHDASSPSSHPPASSSVPSIPLPTSSVTVKPASPAWSTAQAVAGYRAAMRPVNHQLTALSSMSPKAKIGATRTALRAYAQASTGAVESLLAGRWGDELRPGVNTLIAGLLDQETYFDALAGSKDLAAIRAQGSKTSQTLLITRTCAAALEKDLGVGDGLLDLAPSSNPS
jgi:hypothetical protein